MTSPFADADENTQFMGAFAWVGGLDGRRSKAG